jgi:hypothetical protein
LRPAAKGAPERRDRRFDAHVHVVHHSPRSDDKRASGSNTLDAAADVMLGVLRGAGTTRATVTLATMKDGEDGDIWSFDLHGMEIGNDRTGKPIVACYVEITDLPARPEERPAAKTGTAGKPPPPQAIKFFDALRDATIGSNTRMHGCPAARLDDWTRECVKHGLIDPKAKAASARALFSKNRLGLITANWIASDESMAWTLK